MQPPSRLSPSNGRKAARRPAWASAPRPAALRPAPRRPAVSAPPHLARAAHHRTGTLVMVGAGLALFLLGFCLLAALTGFGLLYGSGQVLPGVSSAGVNLGGMSEAEAAAALEQGWASQGILLRDGTRSWAVAPADLGIALDARATAAAARAWGRSSGGLGGLLRSVTGGVDVPPVIGVDAARVMDYLQKAKAYVDLPATNAGVQVVNGQVIPSPAVAGRALDVGATADRMRLDPAAELADGALDLVMIPVAPALADAAPLIAQANALLSSPFAVDAYDPIRDEWFHWSAAPQEWASWLAAAPAQDGSSGLSLAMNAEGPAAFLQGHNAFGDERYLEIDTAVAAMQNALAQNQTHATIRVWHNSTTYTVQAGQTLASIAEEVGIPYPYIQAANPGINADALSAGQELTLPSRDILVPLDPIPNKRIVISRGQQHMWAYENGQVVFDWVVSTGLPSSPTALGVFQIQSHDLNAYADQWNLYMPHFMGFYHPGPNMDLLNGFHGFPTRGGGYLLWTNDLGHPVTYGCVLLSLENAETLYNWAEDGVVVVVQS